MAQIVHVDGETLDLPAIEAVAAGQARPVLTPQARRRLQAAAEAVARLTDSQQPVYGVNTGFGVLATQRIPPDQSTALSLNLVLSHQAGVGQPFAPEIVRAAMLIRANTLAKGLSGVRPNVVERLLQLLEADIVPIVPSQGSLGSSGDLAPLAHLAAAMIAPPEARPPTSGARVWYRGEAMEASQALRQAGLEPLALGPKEGLALTNGATFSAAILALACRHARRLLAASEAAAALSLEALLGVSSALDDRLHAARGHPGQRQVAARLRRLTAGSQLLDATDRVQDAYSLRCIPQVLGPAWETLNEVEEIARREANAATDNPLLFGDTVLSGGNFHGEPIGQACDFLKISLAKVGSLIERRVYRLVSAHTNAGLPPMLVAEPALAGLHSGYMMMQYTAASLVLENNHLAAPDSIHSLPTSAGQEDVNANATTAARNLWSLVSNLRALVAIELLTAARALELRQRQIPDLRPSQVAQRLVTLVREAVPAADEDHPLTPSIETAARRLQRDHWLNAVAETLGSTTEDLWGLTPML